MKILTKFFLILFISLIFSGCNDTTKDNLILQGGSEHWEIELIKRLENKGGELLIKPVNMSEDIRDISVNLVAGSFEIGLDQTTLPKDEMLSRSISNDMITEIEKLSQIKVIVEWNKKSEEITINNKSIE